MDGLGKQFLPSTPAFVRCRLSLISLGLIIALLCHRDVRAHADLDVASLNNAPPQPIMLHHNHRLRDLHHQNRRTAALAAEHTAEPEDESMPLDWNGLWSLIHVVTQPAMSMAVACLLMVNLSAAADPPARGSQVTLTKGGATSGAVPVRDSLFEADRSEDFIRTVQTQPPPHEARTSSSGSHSSGSSSHIVVTDPAEFPRIQAFDHHDPDSLWDNMRPNLFGEAVTDDWDFYNLINTDRPDFTDATYTVGKGVTIIENGYTFTRNNDADLHISRRVLPETLVRVGLTDEFELRMKWYGYLMTDVTDQATGLKDSYFGSPDLYLGFKYEVRQQEDYIPMVTFLGGSTVPTGTGGVSSGAMQPFGNVVIGWGFRRWLYLKMSSGVDFLRTTDVTQVISEGTLAAPVGIHGTDNNSTWHNSVSLLYQATKRVGGFVEWFSFVSNNSADNRAQHYADTGLFLYVTPNVQLDVRIGERISHRVDGMFTGAGLSVRF